VQDLALTKSITSIDNGTKNGVFAWMFRCAEKIYAAAASIHNGLLAVVVFFSCAVNTQCSIQVPVDYYYYETSKIIVS